MRESVEVFRMVSEAEINKMKKCIEAAQKVVEEMGFREFQSDVVGMALGFYRRI